MQFDEVNASWIWTLKKLRFVECFTHKSMMINYEEKYTEVFEVQDFKAEEKYNETFLSLQSRVLFNHFLAFLTSTEHFKII